jgi:hypothetical protein
MRAKNEKGVLKLYAVAGTHTVLISFDLPDSEVRGTSLFGFRLWRKRGNKKTELKGQKTFESLKNDPKLKNLSLIQSFWWKDYLASPGEKYTYQVEALYGTLEMLKIKHKASVKVTTEPFFKGKHGVYFNRGVTGSQAYAKQFGNKKPITAASVNQKALNWLSRELYNNGLVEFVRQAKDKTYELYCAFYEFQYEPFLEEIKKAAKKAKKVAVVYSNKTAQKKRNLQAITGIGIETLCIPRDNQVSQPHNKFMVLCKNKVPIEVWTGSTNITIPGIFGQCNTGHRVKDKAIAKDYKDYWDVLSGNPNKKDLKAESLKIQKDLTADKIKDDITLFFSPRSGKGILKTYADLIEGAGEMICAVYPFNIDAVFKKVFQQDRDFIRYIIVDKAGKKTDFKTNDTDLLMTAGAVLDTKLEKWVKEVTSKFTTGAGVLYVHNKFFLVDPLTDKPVVVTGSANFSGPSLTSNDENTLVIKGDLHVADIYFTEFARLFDHFWPRYLVKIGKKEKTETPTLGLSEWLDEEFGWYNDYYDPAPEFKNKRIETKRRILFTQLKVR